METDKKLTVEAVAGMCHNLNKDYCEYMGDWSQVGWCYAPQWLKDSVITGVRFHLDNPDAGPEASHENWLAEKAASGWHWGEIKDESLKLHPCCIPFE